MKLGTLDPQSGEWLAINCGKFPSEKNGQLVIMAPAHQREGLVEAANAHAVKVRGHPDTLQLGKHLDTLEL